MIEIGRVCVKIAGRDAGQTAVITEILNKNFVMIDGNVRRRKCNIKHLEPLEKVLAIKEKATTKDVLEAMKREKIEIKKKEKVEKKEEKKEEIKEEAKKPAKQRKKKEAKK